jgi:hypothetical protein
MTIGSSSSSSSSNLVVAAVASSSRQQQQQHQHWRQQQQQQQQQQHGRVAAVAAAWTKFSNMHHVVLRRLMLSAAWMSCAFVALQGCTSTCCQELVLAFRSRRSGSRHSSSSNIGGSSKLDAACFASMLGGGCGVLQAAWRTADQYNACCSACNCLCNLVPRCLLLLEYVMLQQSPLQVMHCSFAQLVDRLRVEPPTLG